MDVTLKKIGVEDADTWLKMQVETFTPFLKKYEDYDIDPAAENIEKIVWRMNYPFLHHYFILRDGQIAGGLRVFWWENTNRFRLGIMFILPAFQNGGIGEAAIKQMEALYPQADSWELETLLQEERDLHFYEKLGYLREGEPRVVNDRLTLVFYKKHL